MHGEVGSAYKFWEDHSENGGVNGSIILNRISGVSRDRGQWRAERDSEG
jgi:hypothetical protein